MYHKFDVQIIDKKNKMKNIQAELKMFSHMLSYYKNNINKEIYNSMLQYNSLNIKKTNHSLYLNLKKYPYIIMKQGMSNNHFTFLIHKDYYRISLNAIFQILLKISTQYYCKFILENQQKKMYL